MEAALAYTQEMDLRDEVNKMKKILKCQNPELALHVGVSRSTISQYLNGKYVGKEMEEKVEKGLKVWLETARQETGRLEGATVAEDTHAVLERKWLPEKTQYFESSDYMSVIGLCQMCQEEAALGIVVGRSGYGKTHALRKYAKLPRVAYVECNEAMNQKDLIRRIEQSLGLPKAYGSIDERMGHVVEFFNFNQGYLLIIDEADKLITKYTQKKIELLRNITDAAEAGTVGIVLAGEPALESMIKSYDERFANRMDFGYKLHGLNRKEVEKYLERYDIDGGALEEFVARACNNRTGCFRLFDRTLNNVVRILRESGQTRITLQVIKEASRMMIL